MRICAAENRDSDLTRQALALLVAGVRGRAHVWTIFGKRKDRGWIFPYFFVSVTQE